MRSEQHRTTSAAAASPFESKQTGRRFDVMRNPTPGRIARGVLPSKYAAAAAAVAAVVASLSCGAVIIISGFKVLDESEPSEKDGPPLQF
ncbi:hypothetical protein ACJRO7_011403 [Eucalyptus globulus]|uniref:Uncharacterized protein n=1 Tax=Eucalyptus globulus TaxID=34317 RepID=A0ABD3LF02_EUCGL